jgi:ABC-type nitrate/sulfonate/bicarbonate transport system substrate-binding protein
MKVKSLALVAAGLLLASPALAQVRTAVNVVLFAGNSAMPVYVAQDKGFFARENLTVNVRATPSSGYQMSNLIAGEFDIAGTAIDNLIAYMEGQGTAKVSKTPDLITIMGGSSTELALMAIPSIKTVAELKGKEFALDSLSTGFAFVLRRMLEKNGLQPSDYKFVAVGGTRERVAALREGKMAAALITEPFTTQMRNAGFSYLGEGLDSVGAYQASVQIANREWAKNNEQATIGYIKALLSSIDWLYDPANRDEAVKILAGRVRISEAAARPSIEALTKGRAALARKGELDIEGVKNVIALREQFGQPQKKLGSVEKYIDLSYHQKALGK